jgi:hypothetical protein
MIRRVLVCLLACLAAGPAFGGLTPHQVLVVYNSSRPFPGSQDYLYPQSKAVGDYYCIQRGIPLTNEVGVESPTPMDQNSPHPSEVGTPQDFIYAKDFIDNIQAPLKQFLQTRMGTDPADPESDPIKAIALCHGLPLRIYSSQANSSVERALSLLFSDDSVGMEPIGVGVQNPYYDSTSVYPQNRAKPADFGEFRASTANDSTVGPFSFSIVRMWTLPTLSREDRRVASITAPPISRECGNGPPCLMSIGRLRGYQSEISQS